MMRGAAARLVVWGLACGLAAACASGPVAPPEAPARVVVSDGWLAMGTFFDADLRVDPADEQAARDWLEWARGEVARLEAIYSQYDPDSELSRLNRELAGPRALERDAALSPELEAALFSAVEVWEGTGGAFDVTVGPLVALFRRAEEKQAWPGVEALRRAKRSVGSNRLLLPGEGVLGVTAKAMQIDLDGISKGLVLDRLGEDFRQRLPEAAALLSFGESSILAIGAPGGPASEEPLDREGWGLAIRSRAPGARSLAALRLRDRALSASSSVGSVLRIGDQTLSHVIDARTGSVVSQTVEAIVISPRAAVADGWSTALLALGAQKSTIQLVERAEIEAFVFDSTGRTVYSAGWEEFASFE